MAPGERKSDIRNTGLLHRVRFYSNAAPTACRLGKPIFDVQPAGKRPMTGAEALRGRHVAAGERLGASDASVS